MLIEVDLPFAAMMFKDKAEKAIMLLLEAAEGVEANEQIVDILQAVVANYGPQDNTEIMKSVEAVELSTSEQPEFKLPIRDISFHTTILVPHRIQVSNEFTLSPKQVAGLNAAMGY